MATSKQYLEFVLDLLSLLEDISYRAMMGEYIVYYQGKIIGGVYDDRFLVKPTQSAKRMMPDAPYESPYAGAKEMLLVERIEDKAFLRELVSAMAAEFARPEEKEMI